MIREEKVRRRATDNALRLCEIPGCVMKSGPSQVRRSAGVELFWGDRSLGLFCPRHGRELRDVYEQAAVNWAEIAQEVAA